jgi:hypothetical protein
LTQSFSDQTAIRHFLSNLSPTYKHWLDNLPEPSMINQSQQVIQPLSLAHYFSNRESLSDNISHSSYNSYNSFFIRHSQRPRSDQYQPRISDNSFPFFNRNSSSATTNSQDIKGVPTEDDLKKDEDISDKNLQELTCTICLANKRKVVFIDCNHFATCFNCAKTISQQSKKCPICRKIITHMTSVITS